MKKMGTTWYCAIIIVGVAGINYKMYKDKQAREVSVNSIFPKAKETIANMDGDIAVINNPNSMLVLVNKSRRLPMGIDRRFSYSESALL